MEGLIYTTKHKNIFLDFNIILFQTAEKLKKKYIKQITIANLCSEILEKVTKEK